MSTKEESKVFCVSQTRISQLSLIMSIVSDEKDFEYQVIKSDDGTTVAQITTTEDFNSEATLGKFLERRWTEGLHIGKGNQRRFLHTARLLHTAGVLPSEVSVTAAGDVSLKPVERSDASPPCAIGADEGLPVTAAVEAGVEVEEKKISTGREFYSPTYPTDCPSSQRVAALRRGDGLFSFSPATPEDFHPPVLARLVPGVGLWKVPEAEDVKAPTPDVDAQLDTISDLAGGCWWVVQLDDSVVTSFADAYCPNLPVLENEPTQRTRAPASKGSSAPANAKPAAKGKGAAKRANVFASHSISGVSEAIAAAALAETPGFGVVHNAMVVDIGAVVLSILNETRVPANMLTLPRWDDQARITVFAAVTTGLANLASPEFPEVLFYVSEVGDTPKLPLGVGVFIPSPETVAGQLKATFSAGRAPSRINLLATAQLVTDKMESVLPGWSTLRRLKTPFELFAKTAKPSADLVGVYVSILTSFKRVLNNQVFEEPLAKITSATASTGPSAVSGSGAALSTTKGQKQKKKTAYVPKEVAKDTNRGRGTNPSSKGQKQSTSADGKLPSAKPINGGHEHGDMSVITLIRFEGGVPVSTTTASIPLNTSDHTVVQQILERYSLFG